MEDSSGLAALAPDSTAIVVGGVAIAIFALVRLIPVLRRRADAVDARILIGFHFLRAAGLAFVILGRKGLISPFASRFGFGEIAIAVTAIGVMWLLSVPLDRQPRSLVAWSLFGIVNIGYLLLHLEPRFGAVPETPDSSILPLTIYLWVIVPLAAASQLEILRRSFARK
ncbi:MAG: hypothetical protein ABR517_10835 [Thermoanaerobaculia bacterium]